MNDKMNNEQTERKICEAICQSEGIKAREIARKLDLDRNTVNHVLYNSPLLRELCYQDASYRWHGIIRQSRPHTGLYDFSGYYASVAEFLELTEDEWMNRMTEGCKRIGRNLNDTRGLLHSFRDCRGQMVGLFHDLRERIYADVLVITENRVFSLEFKMKDKVEPDEVSQAAKYLPYLEIVFGTDYEVIPALVLTTASELFEFASIGKSDFILPVCSGDMLFNVFDEYLGFLDRKSVV